MQNVHYLPTLSRENWEGPQGYVHALYENVLKTKIAETGSENLPTANFYLCGWKNMIDEAKEKFMAFGYDKKAIHQELYG